VLLKQIIDSLEIQLHTEKGTKSITPNLSTYVFFIQ